MLSDVRSLSEIGSERSVVHCLSISDLWSLSDVRWSDVRLPSEIGSKGISGISLYFIGFPVPIGRPVTVGNRVQGDQWYFTLLYRNSGAHRTSGHRMSSHRQTSGTWLI